MRKCRAVRRTLAGVRRTCSVLATVAVLPLVLAACAPGAGQVQGVAGDTIKVGTHLPMSGPAAVYGRAYQRSATMVFDEVNAGGGINGRKLEVIWDDDGGDPGKAVASVKKLIERDKVFLIYGGPFTPAVLAAYPVAVEARVIYWSPGASTPQLTRPFNRYIFQAQLTLDDQAIPVSKLVASMKPRKIAFVRNNDQYGQTTRDATVEQLKQRGLSIAVDETIEPNAVSATSQVGTIKEQNADVVIFGGTEKPLTALIREAHKQGFKAPIVSFGGGSTPAIDQLVETEAPVEFYSVTPIACQLSDPCAAEFMGKFKGKFPNEEPLVWDAQGWVAAKAFVEGLKRAGRDLTTEKAVEAWETMPPVSDPLVPYPIQFSKDDHRGVKGGFLYGFKEGKLYFFGDELKK